ncbi:MAG: hypothetical protein IPK15_07690 [Verrucomicrobia bacterium]|nr:hypothetical protein [Verrucomicrobiota bacterium]
MSEHPTTSFRWLRNGSEAFPAMLAAIDAARQTIRLEMYIYTAEAPGLRVRDSLVRAAARGVKVSVLLDALGSFSCPPRSGNRSSMPAAASAGSTRSSSVASPIAITASSSSAMTAARSWADSTSPPNTTATA